MSCHGLPLPFRLRVRRPQAILEEDNEISSSFYCIYYFHLTFEESPLRAEEQRELGPLRCRDIDSAKLLHSRRHEHTPSLGLQQEQHNPLPCTRRKRSRLRSRRQLRQTQLTVPSDSPIHGLNDSHRRLTLYLHLTRDLHHLAQQSRNPHASHANLTHPLLMQVYFVRYNASSNSIVILPLPSTSLVLSCHIDSERDIVVLFATGRISVVSSPISVPLLTEEFTLVSISASATITVYGVYSTYRLLGVTNTSQSPSTYSLIVISTSPPSTVSILTYTLTNPATAAAISITSHRLYFTTTAGIGYAMDLTSSTQPSILHTFSFLEASIDFT